MRQDTIKRQLHEIAEAEVPNGSLDLSDRIRQHVQAHTVVPRPAQRSPRQRFLRPAMVAAAAVAVVALAIGLLPGRTPSVSAQEALRRAEQTTTFGLQGIRSLHGVMEITVPASGDVTREEYWVELPSRMRKDTVWPSGSGKYQTMLTDGTGTWAWATEQPNTAPDSISNLDPAEMDTALYVIPNPTASLDTPTESDGLCSQPGDTLASLGEETMLGRTALVIDCRISDAAEGVAGTHIKLWIDKDIFVVLKSQQFEPSGALFVENAFTQFEVNGTIPSDRFTPPAGVPVE